MESVASLTSYKTRLYPQDDLKEIDRYIAYVDTMLKQFNINFKLDDPITKEIDLSAATLTQLKQFSSLNQVKKSLAAISYKIETSIEYKNIQRIFESSTKTVELMEKKVLELRSELTKDYSNYTKNHVAFEDVIPFSEFKTFFENIYSSDSLSLNQLNYFDENKLFDQIKVNLIVEKTKINDLVSLNQTKIINLSEVSENKAMLSYLQKEYFYSLCKNHFNLNIMYGKMAHSEILSPSHSQSAKLGITNKEVGILTLSLNPINKAPLEKGNRFVHKNLDFEVVNIQETTKVDYFYQLKLNKNTVINLELPIYFSFIRCQLRKI